MKCEQCDAVIEVRSGRVPRFCSGACRQKAYRARKREPAHPFPEEMVSTARWVRADGKRPIMPDGSPASSTNPETWATFQEVQSGAGDGFGFMLGDGIACIDMDNCLDGDVLALWARREADSQEGKIIFVERSISGRGLHLFIRAPERPGRVVQVSGGGTVERYYRARHIRVTGEEFKL